MRAYYNEFDKQKAAWLKELIKVAAIAPGDVDERSIVDVQPDDLRGYAQCHFFAGIGIWSYALRLAGWPDYREVWTGSCPCQPFSAAGKGEAFNDERHLWPEFFRLIEARRPLVCFGEQVALRPLTDSLGSTLFSLTWITRVTPAGQSICALRASEPRTEDSVCIGWPTETPEAHLAMKQRMGERDGSEADRKTITSLQVMAQLSSWKTPCVPNGGRISGNPEDIGKHQDGTKSQIGLENEAKLSGWQSPTVNDSKGRDYTYSQGNHENPFLKLPGEARLTAFGDQPIGFLLGPNGWEIVQASGQLNAAHSRWLMGLPRAWDDCGVTAMASSRKSRRVSSEPI